MKKMIMLTLMFFISVILWAPSMPIIIIGITAPIMIPDLKIKAHELYESKGDSMAYNKVEDAAGILQLRMKMVNEANRIARIRGMPYHFTAKDRWDPDKSRKMWYIVQNYWNPSYDLTLASRLWNSGTIKELKVEKYRTDVRVYCKNVKRIYHNLVPG